MPPDDPDEESPVLSPAEFDRRMNEKVLKRGTREDGPCPRCHAIGYRRIADSEMVALYACRLCGYQTQELHDPREVSAPVFREYREGRGLTAAFEDAKSEGDPP